MKGKSKHIYSVNPRMLLTFAPPEKFIFLTSFVTEKLVVVVATLHVKMKTYWRTIVTTILPTHDSGGFVVLPLPTPSPVPLKSPSAASSS